MDIQIRRVRRTWPERLLLWERAYEPQTQRGHEKISERAKTPESAQALVEKRCFAKDGLAMTNPSASDRSSWGSHHHYPSGHAFFAVYVKPNNRSELVLKRRTDTGDNVLLVQVWQAANDKARELGWIV
jgi:hypothetical protein